MATPRRPAKTKSKFTAEERAAMKDRAREAKGGGDGEREVLVKIAEMPAADRAKAEKLHALVQRNAPALRPRLWYGMPAYASDAGVVCFFQSASKFKTRYATFGFSDKAKLDDGDVWSTAFAIEKLTPAAEATLGKLLEKAAR